MGYGDEDDEDRNPLGSGLGTILRFTGTNVPSRARFIGEAFVSASLFSVTLGLCCGAVGATIFPMTCGPLVPFLTGASFGYTFGLWEHFASVKRSMRFYAHHYPSLLAHALWVEHKLIVPKTVLEASQDQLRREAEEEGQDVCSASMMRQPPLSMTTNVNIPMDQWVFQGGLSRMTWCMTASQNCRADVAAIEDQKRQRLVASILETDDNEEEA